MKTHTYVIYVNVDSYNIMCMIFIYVNTYNIILMVGVYCKISIINVGSEAHNNDYKCGNIVIIQRNLILPTIA